MNSINFNISDDGWCQLSPYIGFVYHDYLGWKVRISFHFIYDKELFKSDSWGNKGTLIFWQEIEEEHEGDLNAQSYSNTTR